MDARGQPRPGDWYGDPARYQPLVTVVIAVSGGLVLDRYGRPASLVAPGADASGIYWFAAWWGLAAAFLFAWWMLWRGRRERAAVWLLLIAAAFSGAAWHDLRWHVFGRHEIGRYAHDDAEPACIHAVACESPERVSSPRPTPLRAIPGSERSRLLVELRDVRDGTRWRPASGLCQLTVEGHLLGVRAGDRLQIFGQLGRPVPPRNPGEFDFAAHSRAERQLARMRSSVPESVSVIEQGSRWSRVSVLDSVRNSGKQFVRKMVGPERAGLAAAILLGAREGLHYDQTEPYMVTGTIHVLVVSGMNVAILAGGLYGLTWAGWLRRRVALAFIMCLVVAYTLVTEAQPPVVRAAVLGILLCLAAWTGRRGVAFNMLAAAALIVLAINPADLFRAGPQLSFLAVATLVWVGNSTLPFRKKPADRLEEMQAAAAPWPKRALRTVSLWTYWLLITSLAVWLATLPLVLLRFHVASPISVLISPAVWVCVVAAMWSGFILLVAGWLVPPLGALCGAVCAFSLSGLEHVVGWAESAPAGHFWAPGPAWWWVVGFYCALLAAMIWGRALAPLRWQVAALAAWTVVGVVPPLARAATRDALECSFVAVGHGTCVVLETPSGETLLYDAGALGAPEYATQTIASYLWHRGILRIDGLVISHADVDHYNAVPGLLERFYIGTVYVSPVMFDGFGENDVGSGPQLLREAIQNAGVPIREIWAGDELRVGPELTIHVLHPPRRGVIGSDNANSVTLAIEYAGRRVLLPGDLEPPGLDDLLAELPYDCDVLLAPHHGSRQSDPPGFASWSKPEWVIISGGRNDEAGPVIQTYEHAGAEVLRTHEAGTLRFSMRPSGIRAAGWHDGGFGVKGLVQIKSLNLNSKP